MMRVVHSIADWQRERRTHPSDQTLGFVPTMGALHEGHLSLVRRSQAENTRTLVSIFVNPTQFNDAGDLATYPRTIEADAGMLAKAGVDFLLVPPGGELYADGYRYRVSESDYSRTLEGAFRPGHFDGVLTVVLKLLLIADADHAYFGEKDWQQLMLVKGLAEAFFLRTEVVGCPTIRESDGLAMSSRNRRLSEPERATAARFLRTLRSRASADNVRRTLADEGFVVDYVEDRQQRRLAAVRVGDVRLIDNIALEDLS